VIDPVEPAVAKDDLRDFLLARRRARPPAESTAAADAIVSALLEGLRGVGTLAAFVPDPSEPGSGRLPAAYTVLGAQVLLPVIPSRGRVLD
jgi:5-formyltetrahydrofolate cyclo-ligase